MNRHSAKIISAAEDTAYNERNVLESLSFGVFWLDQDYVVAGCNNVFVVDCGFKGAGRIVGRSVRDLFSDSLCQKIVSECALVKSDGETRTIEIAGLFKPKSGNVTTFVLTGLKNADGRVGGFSFSYGPSQLLFENDRHNRENEQKYRTLFEHSDEGMWLIRDHYFTNANPSAARMLGYENAEALSNLHPSELSPEFQPDGQPSFEKAGKMMELAKANGSHRFEWDHKKKSGEVFPVDVTLTRVPIDGQDILLCTWRDITEQKAAQETLREARDAAESMTRMKSEFLSNMSHEIRTPMTGILGMLSLIPESELSERNWGCVTKARMSAQALLSIINDILDLSRLEAGRTSVEITNVDVPDTIQQVIDLLENKAREKGLQLRTDIAEQFPSPIKIDGRHLRQILLNLTGNAIKFTNKGEIVIGAQFVKGAGGQPFLKCSVKDTGIGIPADRLESVFNRFQQVDSSASRSHEGTGLGLAICRELVELHGGDISVESAPGKGSQFNVTLPVEIGIDCGDAIDKKTPEAADSNNAPGTDRELDDIHILIAEDNAVNQMVISMWLENLGVSHEIQGDGAKVLARLTAPKPDDRAVDVILMDIQMPVIGGLEATQKIRSFTDARLASLPIIALTANAMAGQAQEYVAAGMDGYMSKPIDFDALEAEIRRVLGR